MRGNIDDPGHRVPAAYQNPCRRLSAALSRLAVTLTQTEN